MPVVAALKRVMENEGMDLEIIVNPKVTDDGQAVIQVFERMSQTTNALT